MRRPCPITIICPPTTGTPDPDWPITNVSAEAPDPLIFSSVTWPEYDPYTQPPLGKSTKYIAFDCYGIMYSAESQAMADLMALVASYSCQEGRGGLGDQYANDAQTGTATCPDGTQASYTVPAGMLAQNFVDPEAGAAWVEWANAWMLAYATAMAAANLMCITPDPNPTDTPHRPSGPSPYLRDNPGWMCLGEELTVENSTYSISNAVSSLAFTFTADGLPPGTQLVQLTPQSAAIVGEPSAPGIYLFTITATSTTQPTITLTVTDVLYVLGFTTDETLPDAVVCAEYSQQLEVEGGIAPFTFSADLAMPEWLSLSSSGLLTGTPQQEDANETTEFIVNVTDAEGRGPCSKAFTITVGPCPTITITPTSQNGVTTAFYSCQLVAAGGTGPYSFGQNSGTMPDGLGMDDTGLISGTPTTPGSYTVGVTAVDSCGCAGTQDVDIEIGVIGSDAITSIPCPTNAALSIPIVPPIEQYRYVAPTGTSANKGALDAKALRDATAQAAAAGWPGCACYFTAINVVSDVSMNVDSSCPIQLNGYGSDANGNMAGPLAPPWALVTFPLGNSGDLHGTYDANYGPATTATVRFVPFGSAGIPANVVLIYYHKGH